MVDVVIFLTLLKHAKNINILNKFSTIVWNKKGNDCLTEINSKMFHVRDVLQNKCYLVILLTFCIEIRMGFQTSSRNHCLRNEKFGKTYKRRVRSLM